MNLALRERMEEDVFFYFEVFYFLKSHRSSHVSKEHKTLRTNNNKCNEPCCRHLEGHHAACLVAVSPSPPTDQGSGRRRRGRVEGREERHKVAERKTRRERKRRETDDTPSWRLGRREG